MALAWLSAGLAPTVPAWGAQRLPVVYDSDYDGYVPVVDGIARPDLAARDGRLPTSARTARRRGKRALRKAADAPVTHRLLLPREGAPLDEPLPRRFLKRRAIVTDLLVLGEHEQPIEGARVYRYHDPSFYGVSEAPDGARLFGLRRWLPYPFPAVHALELVRDLDPWWRQSGYTAVQRASGRWSPDHHPFGTGFQALPRLPIEYLGRTGTSGTLRSISGIFDMADPRRFPGSIFPRKVRVGFVVVAEGYQPGLSELQYTQGGVTERRTVHLLKNKEHAVLGSLRLRVAALLVDGLALADRSPEDIDRALDRFVERLEGDSARLEKTARRAALAKVRSLLLARLLRRAGAELRVPLARRGLQAEPDALAWKLLLARELIVAERRQAHWSQRVAPRTPNRIEARRLLEAAIRQQPRCLPAFVLLDGLLVETGAAAGTRRAWLERLLEVLPFDAWGRARLAAIDLEASRIVESFDHLRYTWMTQRALRGDRELALALARYYWHLGLPEKSGSFVWLHTGHAPEDPLHPLPEEPDGIPARDEGAVP
ncbi:MAG: hypothetical protein Q9Q13_03430 [Acidobacteriota bacterium]|nr:hypothetical protein [Acidobacteriota bacterium]